MLTFIVIFVVIAILLLLVVKYDLIPDFDSIMNKKSKIKDQEQIHSVAINDNKTVPNKQDFNEKRVVAINLDVNQGLTQDDIELRETLFEKHIKHHQTYEGPNGEIKANIPFQAVIFLTRNYNPLVNEYGEIVVSVKKDTDKLILSDVLDGSPVNKLVNAPDIQLKENIQRDIIFQQDDIEKIIIESLVVEEKSSVLDSLNLDDLLSEDEYQEESLDSNVFESDSMDNENVNPFGDTSSVEDETELVLDADITSKSKAENAINENLTKISKDIIEADSVISGNIDFYDTIEIVAEDHSVQQSIINNLFLDNKVGFFEDKTILIPLETIARAIAIAISNKHQYQIIAEKQLKNTKNTSTIESLFGFILSNENYIIESKKHNHFKTFAVKIEDGKECKVFGIKLAPNFIKDFLPDVFNYLMKHPPKIITHTTNSPENFCD